MWSRLLFVFAAVIVCCSCNRNISPSHEQRYDVCTGSELEIIAEISAIAGEFGLVEERRQKPESDDVPVAVMFSSPERGELVLSLFYFRGRISLRTYQAHMHKADDYSHLVASISRVFEPVKGVEADGLECFRASRVNGARASIED
jgi:hypothetical protein